MNLMREELEQSARAEIAAYRKEIHRSHHQMMQELGQMAAMTDRYSKQFMVKERAITAQHYIRTEHLELACLALEDQLIQYVALEIAQPIVATRR